MTTNRRIYEQGYDAFPDLNMIDNPYEKWSPEYMQWNDGWKQKWFEELPRPMGATTQANGCNDLAPISDGLSAAPAPSATAGFHEKLNFWQRCTIANCSVMFLFMVSMAAKWFPAESIMWSLAVFIWIAVFIALTPIAPSDAGKGKK